MQELVTYSEEGNKFEDQKDVPGFIPSSIALTGTPEDVDVDEWDIPVLRDNAIEQYGIFHCARVSSDFWKASIQKAATFTFQQ
ncbi:hypothetical protein ACQKWADRAFT_297855, partial [Trichoderma austrokoningii]